MTFGNSSEAMRMYADHVMYDRVTLRISEAHTTWQLFQNTFTSKSELLTATSPQVAHHEFSFRGEVELSVHSPAPQH